MDADEAKTIPAAAQSPYGLHQSNAVRELVRERVSTPSSATNIGYEAARCVPLARSRPPRLVS
jgi:hypothetical protein